VADVLMHALVVDRDHRLSSVGALLEVLKSCR